MVDAMVDRHIEQHAGFKPALPRQSDHLNSKVNTVNAVNTSSVISLPNLSFDETAYS